MGNGEVFSIPASGGSLTILTGFNVTDGMLPGGSLTLIGSTLYGTSEMGGNTSLNNGQGVGEVFSIATSGGSPKVLAALNDSVGTTPYDGVAFGGNTLYLGTQYGGSGGKGTVISLATSGGTPKVLASFNNNNGASIRGNLLLVGNTLYGVAEASGPGAYGEGLVFSVATSGGGSLKTMATFSGSNGGYPYGGLTLVGSNLYGCTSQDGPGGDGTIYSIPLSGGSLTTLASFNGSNGWDPYATLVLIGSSLYGTCYGGGAYGDGTIFSIPASGGSLTTLFNFNDNNGARSLEPHGQRRHPVWRDRARRL